MRPATRRSALAPETLDAPRWCASEIADSALGPRCPSLARRRAIQNVMARWGRVVLSVEGLTGLDGQPDVYPPCEPAGQRGNVAVAHCAQCLGSKQRTAPAGAHDYNRLLGAIC